MKIFGIVEDRAEQVWYWAKHHAISLAFCAAAVLLVVWFVGSRTAYVMIDNTPGPPRTYQAGIKVMTQMEIPDPNYIYSRPELVTLLCVDGTKILMTQMAAIPIGDCP